MSYCRAILSAAANLCILSQGWTWLLVWSNQGSEGLYPLLCLASMLAPQSTRIRPEARSPSEELSKPAVAISARCLLPPSHLV